MKFRLLITLIVVAAITLALAGWAVQGIRWLVSGWVSRRRPRLATA
jgi:hypothetical protein